MHPIFNVSQLKKVSSMRSYIWSNILSIVLAVRNFLNETKHVLVRLEGLSEAENTRKKVIVMIHIFPYFNLEDKVKLVREY
jgi:hypothetical protein